MVQALREVSDYREFLKEFVLQTLRSRYRGSVLGFLWTLLNPLLVCLSFAVIFSVINRVSITDYVPWFLAGYLPWLFFVSTGNAATTAVIGNAHYVARIFVPKSIFPLSVMLVSLVDLLTSLAVLLALMAAAFPFKLHAAVLFLPVAVVILAVFCVGIAFLFATLNVFFRDFAFLWATLSFVWFFFTPILYRLEQMPEQARGLFALNFVYPFIRMFQDCIDGGVLPSGETILTAMLYAAIMFIVGTGIFLRSQRQFYMYV